METPDNVRNTTDEIALIGEEIDEKYKVTGLLGRGGMSVVYKVRHRYMKTYMALKMLLPQLAVHEQSVKRFQQEAEAASVLKHPNIVGVHDFGMGPNKRLFLVMDLLEGDSLHDIIEKEGKLDVERCLDIFIQTTKGLVCAHDHGIVHRDLKPSNIVISKDEKGNDLVKIVDFGLAKLLPTSGDEIQRLTQTGEIFGSPYYMSPEQCTGDQTDVRSDIYSFGCVMYEALTGKTPFKGKTVIETMYLHMNESPERLTEIGLKGPLKEQLEHVVFKCLAKDPLQRYQSSLELLTDLEQVQQGVRGGFLNRLKAAWELAQLRRVPRKTRKRMLVAFLIASGLLVGTWAFMAPVIFVKQTPPPVLDFFIRPEPISDREMELSRQVAVSEHAIKMHRAMFEKSDPGGLADRYEKLALTQKELHKWEEAGSFLKEAIELRKKAGYPEDDPHVITDKLNLADCYYEQGEEPMATGMYSQALLQQHAVKLFSRLRLARPFSRLGDLFIKQGNYKMAERSLDEGVYNYEDKLKPKTYLDESLKDKHHQAWEIAQSQGKGMKSPEYAFAVSRFADAQRLLAEGEYSQGKKGEAGEKFKQAESNYRRARNAWDELKNRDYERNIALCDYRLGQVQLALGKPGPAEKNFASALKKLEGEFGARSPYLLGILDDYSSALWKRNNWIKSVILKLRANWIRQAALKEEEQSG